MVGFVRGRMNTSLHERTATKPVFRSTHNHDGPWTVVAIAVLAYIEALLRAA
jgi:hypothetical protein